MVSFNTTVRQMTKMS